MIKVGIGQDSHRIIEGADNPDKKPLLLGGHAIAAEYALSGNSDADVLLHAATNAVSGITCKPVLGPVADALCKQGITDSAVYFRKALQDLHALGYSLVHLSLSVECARPKIIPHMESIRRSMALLAGISMDDVGITATSGEGLTDFGKGLGIQAFCTATAKRREA